MRLNLLSPAPLSPFLISFSWEAAMRYLILILLLATCAGAAPVDPSDPDGVAALVRYGGNAWVLNTNGEVWACGRFEWEHFSQYDIPMPVSEVCEWDHTVLRDCQGQIWSFGVIEEGEWTPAFPLPWEPIQEESRSLGDVKSMFR